MKGFWQAWNKSKTRFRSADFSFIFQICAKIMRSQWKFYFECMIDIFKIAGNPGEQKCDWCDLSIIHFWLWHFGKILDEILLEVKAKLMLFEGVGLIFTGGCATFYKLSMNFIIYKILCSFATNTKWSLGKLRLATLIFRTKLYSYFINNHIHISYTI